MTTICVQMKTIIMVSPDRADCIFFFQHGGVQPPRTHTRRARKASWASADNDYIRIIHLALVKFALWLAIERVSSGEPDKTGNQKKGWV
jgi:hypothetical protein